MWVFGVPVKKMPRSWPTFAPPSLEVSSLQSLSTRCSISVTGVSAAFSTSFHAWKMSLLMLWIAILSLSPLLLWLWVGQSAYSCIMRYSSCSSFRMLVIRSVKQQTDLPPQTSAKSHAETFRRSEQCMHIIQLFQVQQQHVVSVKSSHRTNKKVSLFNVFVCLFRSCVPHPCCRFVSVRCGRLYRTSKVNILTGSSVLHTVWGSVLIIHSDDGATYTLFLRICGATMRVVLENCRLGAFWRFFANFVTIKDLFPEIYMCAHHPRTRRHFCAKSDVLNSFQSSDIVWRKTGHLITHPDTQLITPSVNRRLYCYWQLNLVEIRPEVSNSHRYERHL